MPGLKPLDDALGAVFGVGDALDARHSRHRLTRGDVTAPYRGVRRRAGSRDDEFDDLRDYVPLLRPGDRFSHTTAARLWGVPLPRSADQTLHVTAARAGQPRSPGVAGHRAAIDDSVPRRGLPSSAPSRLFLELATMLSLDDLVAAGDHLVLDPPVADPEELRPWTSVAELGAAAAAHRGRGARRARAAALLVRPGAESRPESLLRLLLRRSGLPEPELNPEIFDGDGRRIGRFDLVWHAERVIVEYDGDQHRTSTAQYERDISRFDRAADAAWRVVRVRARGLFTEPDSTVRRVTRALIRTAP